MNRKISKSISFVLAIALLFNMFAVNFLAAGGVAANWNDSEWTTVDVPATGDIVTFPFSLGVGASKIDYTGHIKLGKPTDNNTNNLNLGKASYYTTYVDAEGVTITNTYGYSMNGFSTSHSYLFYDDNGQTQYKDIHGLTIDSVWTRQSGQFTEVQFRATTNVLGQQVEIRLTLSPKFGGTVTHNYEIKNLGDASINIGMNRVIDTELGFLFNGTNQKTVDSVPVYSLETGKGMYISGTATHPVTLATVEATMLFPVMAPANNGPDDYIAGQYAAASQRFSLSGYTFDQSGFINIEHAMGDVLYSNGDSEVGFLWYKKDLAPGDIRSMIYSVALTEGTTINKLDLIADNYQSSILQGSMFSLDAYWSATETSEIEIYYKLDDNSENYISYGAYSSNVVTSQKVPMIIDTSSLALGEHKLTLIAMDAEQNSSEPFDIIFNVVANWEIPNAQIDYINEKLVGLEPSTTYSFNGTVLTTNGNGEVDIPESWMGISDFYIIKKGIPLVSEDSQPQILPIPLRPNPPKPTAYNASSAGVQDGSINDVDTSMWYQISGTGNWTTVTGTSISSLVAENYDVQIKATVSSFASVIATVTVGTDSNSDEIPSLVVDNVVFTDVIYGDTGIAENISVFNAGTGVGTISDITVSGTSFETISSSTTDVQINDYNTSWQIKPADGLNVGTHIETITVTYDSGATTTSRVKMMITAKSVTISGIDAEDKIYDGNVEATITGTPVINGKIAGNDLYVSMGAARFQDKNVNDNIPVTFSGFTLAGNDAGNYILAEQPTSVTANITQKGLTIEGLSAENKEYDGNTVAVVTGTPNIVGRAGANDVSLDSTLVQAKFNNKNVGNNKTVTVSGYSLTGADASNYYIISQPVLSANITAKELTINPIVNNKAYDGLNTATFSSNSLDLIGKITDDVVSIDNMPTPTFTSIDVGTGIAINLSGAFTITGIDGGNYTITQPTGLTANITDGFTPSQNTHYTVNTPDGDNGWFKLNDFVITAESGYALSTNNTDAGPWTTTITQSAETSNADITFYVRNKITNEISVAQTESYKKDGTSPVGEIDIETNKWNSFLNTITFGYFFKNTVDVSISSGDALSGVAKVEYYLSETVVAAPELIDAWIEDDDFSIQPNEKFTLYAKITDNAGNVTIINSDGIVVYTDSVQDTVSISFTKTSTTDVTAKVTLNGNTVAGIMNGTTDLTPGTDYEVTGATITFKANYLDSLLAGDYTFTISYNPMGEVFEEGISVGVAPLTTTINLAVSKAEQDAINIIVNTCTYGDDPIAVGFTGGNGMGAVTYESSNPEVASFVNNVLIIHKPGDFTITVTKDSDDNYNSKIGTKNCTIEKADVQLKLEVDPSEGIKYGEKVTLTATVVGVENGIIPSGTVSFYKDGESIQENVNLIDGVAIIEVDDFVPGKYNISVQYNGSDYYNTYLEADMGVGENTKENYTVDKLNQEPINIEGLEKEYFMENNRIKLSVTGGSTGGKVTYQSSNPSVAKIEGNEVVIIGTGEFYIIATMEGNDYYYDVSTESFVVTVVPVIDSEPEYKPNPNTLDISELATTVSFVSILAFGYVINKRKENVKEQD